MKNYAAFMLFLFSVTAYSQVEFEPGHYIDNQGTKISCLIKNRDWRDNPTQFEIKTSESDAEVVKTINEIAELVIDNTAKFVRADVQIDRASKNINFISTNKNPVFTSERLFLKVLSEGRFTLYSFEQEGLSRFFYRKADGTTKQLVYKKYYPSATDINPRANPNDYDYTITRENNQYRVQLWSDVRCEKTDIASLDKLKYERKSLTTYFNQVNECFGAQSSVPTFTAERRKGKFYAKAAVGVQQQLLKIKRVPSYLSSDMNETGITVGVEFEYIFPWNNNKWSLIFEPQYSTFDSKSDVGTTGPYESSVHVKFNYLSFPIGMRHYMFLNDNSKFFLSGVLSLNYMMDGKWEYEHSADLYVLETLYSFGFGLGYDYKRYSAEVRYYTPMNLHSVADSKFSRIGLTGRFRFF